MSIMDCRIATAIDNLLQSGATVRGILDVLSRFYPVTEEERLSAERQLPGIAHPGDIGFGYPVGHMMAIDRDAHSKTMILLAWACCWMPPTSLANARDRAAIEAADEHDDKSGLLP
jgi:hypothetical protein